MVNYLKSSYNYSGGGMSSDIDNPNEEYRKITKSLKDLYILLKITKNPDTRAEIQRKIRKLEARKTELTTIFSFDDVDEENEKEDTAVDAAEQDFPILNSAEQRFRHEVSIKDCPDSDFKPLLLYMRYFETELLGILSVRKLKLDVKFSIQRDNYYNRFSELNRNLQRHLKEQWRLEIADYSKAYEEELLKRRIETKHQLLFELHNFFNNLFTFAKTLEKDISGAQILCLNNDVRLEYSNIDSETVLRGKKVSDAVIHLKNFSSEFLEYLDMPDI